MALSMKLLFFFAHIDVVNVIRKCLFILEKIYVLCTRSIGNINDAKKLVERLVACGGLHSEVC